MPKAKNLFELRSEYYTLRKTFNKRIARLAKGSKTQQSYARPFQKGGQRAFKSLTELGEVAQSEKLLAREIRDLKMYLNKDRLSLAGWKKIEKQTISQLKSAGYNISKKNIQQFGDYMELMRTMYGSKIFPSEEIAEAYDQLAEQENVPIYKLYDLIGSFRNVNTGIDLFL